MSIKNKDRYLLAEAYNLVQDCECQHSRSTAAMQNNDEERIDMILNNLVNLNNKSAEIVNTMQNAIDSGEGIEEWVSEKIAVAASMITSISDYYAKFKDNNQISVVSLNNVLGTAGKAVSIASPQGALNSLSI